MQVNGTEIVIALVSLMFTAVIAPLVKAGIDWLKGKTQNEAVLSALDEAQIVADSVIAGLEAGVVAELKEKSADGKLSTDDAKTVATMAAEQLVRDLSEKSLEVIEQSSDDISSFLSNLIEERLMKMKQEAS